MGSSLSSSSSPSQSYTVPGSFEQQQNQNREQGERNQGERDNTQMASGPKNPPPKYQRDPQPQSQSQQRQPEMRSVGADQPPRYSGYSGANGPAGPRALYVDSRYEYGMRMCMRGQHDYRTEYGLAGILCAIFCFPCGLLGLCIDVERICRRCGARRL